MTPPETTHLVILHLRVMFVTALDGLKVGQVRHGLALPGCRIGDRPVTDGVTESRLTQAILS